MGVFWETAVVKHVPLSLVKEEVTALLQTEWGLSLEKEDCRYMEYDDGIRVVFDGGSVLGLHELAERLSRQLGEPVFLAYIYYDDFWGYYLYSGETGIDAFSTIPDYFTGTKEEAEEYAGKPEVIAQHFGVEVDNIKNYYVPWTEEMLEAEEERRAYWEDVSAYGDCWQVEDFMDAIGFPYNWEQIDEVQYLQEQQPPQEAQAELKSEEKAHPESFPEPPKTYGTRELCTEHLPNAMNVEYIRSVLSEEMWQDFICRPIHLDTIRYYTNLIGQTPDDSRLYLLRAYFYMCLGRNMEMDKDLGNALQYDPDNIRILRKRCPVAATKKRYARHIEELTRLMELDPEYCDIYLLDRAWRYYWTNDLEKAKEDMSKLDVAKMRNSIDFNYLFDLLDSSKSP